MSLTYATANDLPAEIWEVISRDLLHVGDRNRDGAPAPVPPKPLGTPLDDIMDREPGRKPSKKKQNHDSSGMLPSLYMGINRHLFNLYLDAKYKEVEWTRVDEDMETQLRRLQ
jgi:hypothetical protein